LRTIYAQGSCIEYHFEQIRRGTIEVTEFTRFKRFRSIQIYIIFCYAKVLYSSENKWGMREPNGFSCPFSRFKVKEAREIADKLMHYPLSSPNDDSRLIA
jgi:hypothetical protein